MRRLKGILNETFSAAPQQQQHHRTNLQIPPTSSQLDVEEAETAVFNSIVDRTNNRQRRRLSSADIAYRSLLNYGRETKAIEEVDEEDLDVQQQQQHQHQSSVLRKSNNSQSTTTQKQSSQRFREAAWKIRLMEKASAGTTSSSQTAPNASMTFSSDGNITDDNDPLLYDEYDQLNNSTPQQQHPEYGTMAEAFTNARKKRKQIRPLQHLQQTLSISNVTSLIQYISWHSAIVWVGIPASILSWILFYCIGDPELDFLPGQIALSWWLNFLSRQTVTFDAARCMQYLLLDIIIGTSPTIMKILGPGICQYCIKSNGWPAVAVGWSFLNLIVLHGDDKFVKHWLYWTGLRIYDLNSSINGNNLIGSILYLRLLMATMIAGLATSMKRFLLDFQFKQRQCLAFKSRLEKLLLEMILVADIAFLADHAPIIQNMSQGEGTTDNLKSKSMAKSKMSEHISFDLTSINVPIDESDMNDEEFEASQKQQMPFRGKTMSLSSSGLLIKDLLDVWEPPENKSDKNNVSVRDVLRFQSALGFINAEDPFGESFGPTFDRDNCIKSSMQLYAKLLLLNSNEDKVLNFDVLLLAICNDEGMTDSVKRKSLIRLFRPDAKNHVTELAFVQSCDAVYKRLRYFQASVGNASVIDNVLAGIVDAFFYFLLVLIILSLLEINPWTLLVSITSLLVSISFALGPSVSKYVEGVLLIAVRRPFDLGDRIYIGPPDTTSTASPGANVDMSNCTWFVEDINLSTTTLRFARTNEVSTMNNWAIAGSKIINCNRSPGALVVLNMVLHVSIFEKTTLEEFQAELQQYIVTHPRIWDSLVFCRHDNIDADLEQVSFQYVLSFNCTSLSSFWTAKMLIASNQTSSIYVLRLSFRHRNSWQDAGRIKLHRADLVRFIYELSVKLRVHFETPPPRRLLYHGGTLAHGQVLDFKRNLLIGANILNQSSRQSMDDSSVGLSRPINVSRDYSTSEPVFQGE